MVHDGGGSLGKTVVEVVVAAVVGKVERIVRVVPEAVEFAATTFLNVFDPHAMLPPTLSVILVCFSTSNI